MTKTLRTLLAAAALALGFSLPASAVTNGTDFTDLWWNSAEPGWGLNVIHQNGVIFATLFIYDQAGVPHFYSASETRGSGNAFSGPLYETHGTYFAVNPYNAGQYGATAVGSISLAFSTANSGSLNYSVNGVNVSKAITRFTFAQDTLAGNYLGGMTANSTCSGQNQLTLIFDTMSVVQNGNAITMTVNFFNGAGVQSRCVFSGSYTPMGRQGNISGSYSCTFGSSQGNTGSFAVANIEASQNGWNGRFTGSDQFCSSHNGFMGGVRDVL